MLTQDAAVRAWKDPSYRATLSDVERAALPTHPAGLVELSDAELTDLTGGTTIVCVAITIVLLVQTCSEVTRDQ